MTGLLAVWLILLIVLWAVVTPRPGRGGPLTLAYFFSLALIHVPGALSYVGGATIDSGLNATIVGFQFTLLGAAAFICGASVVRRKQNSLNRVDYSSALPVLRLGNSLLTIGAVSYFFLRPLAGFVPSLTSVVSTLSLLLIIGLWIRIYASIVCGRNNSLIISLAVLPVLPLVTLTSGGFVGFGVSWAIAAVMLIIVISRRRLFLFAAIPVVMYLGLSFFVTYAAQRNDIRDVVWSSRSTLTERLDSVLSMVTSFRLLDLSNNIDATSLRNRLNQNILIGVGIIRHQNDQVNLVYGETFQPWLLIPRALWPGKPDVAGSGMIVTNFTGINFSASTSVGAGQVLEFYYNFGTIGVILGFFSLGILIRYLDGGLMTGLAQGNIRMVLLNGMPGLALLQPGGSVIETAVSAIAALVAGHVVLFYARRRRQPAPRQQRRRIVSTPSVARRT